MQNEDIKQIALLSDATYALSIPNRATSNLENDLKVIIRHKIQQKCMSGEDCPIPFILSLDIRQIAKEKGVNWRTLERNLDKAIEVLKQTRMNETVSYIAENGDRKTDTLYILDKISKNETQRTVEVKVSVSYTEYLIKRLLKNPELCR